MGRPFPTKIAPSHWVSGPHLIHGSLGPPKSSTQTASQSVQPFLHTSLLWQTGHATWSVITGCIYVLRCSLKSKGCHTPLSTAGYLAPFHRSWAKFGCLCDNVKIFTFSGSHCAEVRCATGPESFVLYGGGPLANAFLSLGQVPTLLPPGPPPYDSRKM